MSIISIIIGIALVAVCFGLMVWGQNYLGEERGRNPETRGRNDGSSNAEGHTCRGCGSCASSDLLFNNKKTEPGADS
jgi:hypothetical protein